VCVRECVCVCVCPAVGRTDNPTDLHTHTQGLIHETLVNIRVKYESDLRVQNDCARGSGSRDLTQQIGSRKADVNKEAVPHIKSYS